MEAELLGKYNYWLWYTIRDQVPKKENFPKENFQNGKFPKRRYPENFQRGKFPKLKITKVENHQSWKSPKLKITQVENYPSWKLPKLKITKVENYQLKIKLKISKGKFPKRKLAFMNRF